MSVLKTVTGSRMSAQNPTPLYEVNRLSQLKAAASKETTSVVGNTTPLELSSVNSAQVGQKGTAVPMIPVYQTLQDDEKIFAISKYQRSRKMREKVRDRMAKQSWKNISNQAGVMDYATRIKALLSDLSSVQNIPMSSSAVKHIEQMVLLYCSVSKAVDVTQALSIMGLYLETFFDRSLCESVLDKLTQISVSNQAGGTPDWLALLKQAQTNWKLVIANEGFSHLSNVISIMLGLGLCNNSDINFDVAGMQLFSIHAHKKQVCALDLGDAIFSTVMYFVEGGYECFRSGSISPLLHGNFDYHALEEKIEKCQSLFDYAITGNLRKQHGMDPNDYDNLLRTTIEEIAVQVKITKNAMVERILRDKREKLLRLRTAFDQRRVKGGLREDPYGMGFFGNSGVGKSSVSNIMMIVVLMHNGYSAADDRIITLNEADAYDSTYTSDINGVQMDDIGNSKADFVQKAPTQKYLELHNNVRQYANMAEAEMKGKVSKEPKVVNSTRNVFMSHATTYSNKPVSILRREDFTAVVRVKPEFATMDRLDQGKVLAAFPNEIIPDVWEMDLYEFYEDEPNSSNLDVCGDARARIIEWNGKQMESVSIHEAIRFACQRSAHHFECQAKLVEKQTNVAEQIRWCTVCNMPRVSCFCPPVTTEDLNDASRDSSTESVVSDQFGNLMYPIVRKYLFEKAASACNFGDSWLSYFEEESTELLVETLDWYEHSMWSCWTNWLPRGMLDNPYVENFVLLRKKDELRHAVLSYYVLWGMLFFVSIPIVHACPLFIFVWPYILWRVAVIVEVQKKWMYKRICDDNEAMPGVFRKHRDSLVNYVTWSCIALSFIYLVAKTWKLVRVVQEDQGNLMPSSYDEIQERDREAQLEETIAQEMNWSTVQVQPIPCHTKCATPSNDEMIHKVCKNLGLISYKEGSSTYGCDIFFVESNLALIPQHIWKGDERLMTVQHGKVGQRPRTFTFQLSRKFSANIPETDFSLVYVPNGGSWQNLVDYLPEGEFRNVPGTLVHYRVKDGVGVRRRSSVFMKNGGVHNHSKSFRGSEYELEWNTFVGLCMAPIITDTKQKVLGGFHLGGVTGENYGVSGLLTKQQYLEARARLASVSGVTCVASSGTLRTELYGKKFLLKDSAHVNSPIHHLPEQRNIEYYGTCAGGATYYSDVVDLPIKKSVENHCGVENQHGKPKFHLGQAWKESLKVSCNPSVGVEGKYLSAAVDDYVEPLISSIESIPELREYIRPLNEMETVCGIDGLRFVDKLKGSTSVGYPLSGSKEKYISPLDPEDFPDFVCPVELDSQFWEEERYMEREYLEGRRVYFVFKACLKDEPTKLSKDKVRVFQASSVAAQLAIRKFFLPIVRLLSLFPLVSECGVGINSMGPEFSALVEHMRKYGSDRILAGDYSKYDLRMAAQLTLAAFDVLITIAAHFGYSEEHLTIMRGIATDVCYPVTAFNGDLIQLLGSNPSGQNLTVYINSIVNSLLLRSAFFHIYQGRDVPSFREVAAMMTYGDDVKGSVRKGFDEFNHVSYADFLSERDMVFTMPDKESEPVPYMDSADADYLKRSERWSDELQLWQGMLSEESIFKSLMVVLKSKSVTLREQSSQNIDGALREWFNYGRDHYELRREQMRVVAQEHGLTQSCLMLPLSYDDCLERYRERYRLGLSEKESL